MKRFILLMLILSVSVNIVQAQHKAGSSMLLFNVGFVSVSPEYSENELTGNSFNFWYEITDFNGNLAGGVSVGYMSTSTDSVTNSGQIKNKINSASYDVIPIMFYGRYLFGPEKFRGYIGAGIGIQFSTANFYSQDVQIKASDSGLLIGGIIGANYFISEKMLINANFNINWLSNSFFQNGTASNFAIGIGFQI